VRRWCRGLWKEKQSAHLGEDCVSCRADKRKEEKKKKKKKEEEKEKKKKKKKEKKKKRGH